MTLAPGELVIEIDDDGKIYVGHGYNNISITELDTNFVAKGSDVLVFTGDIRNGLEGTHVYKINGYYYLYCTYGGGDGFQVALRSENIYGPYEEKIVIRDNGNLGTGIHQGALVETQTGEWWSVIFQDGGAFGRFPTLQPVTWQDDWPMVGVNGKGVVTYQKPNVGKEYPIKILPTSDEFDSTKLGLQWGWNHNPDSTKWSLTQRPGYLRLTTAKVVSNLRDARNTLTQRIFAYYSRTIPTNAVVKMEIDSMKDGDIAGLAVFQNPYAFIGVKQTNGQKYVMMVNNGKTIDSTLINTSTIYLKAQANYGTSRASFAYGLNDQSFGKLGNNLSMKFDLSIFTGNKFCLFNYATIETGGFVDFDWFRIDWSELTDVEIEENTNNVPNDFFLEQNYPNPFNPSTKIKFDLPEESEVKIRVYDMLGREVSTLLEGVKAAGWYTVDFDGTKLSSGVYVYVMNANNRVFTRKMILLR